MAQEYVEAIIVKAINDDLFRLGLIDNFDATISSYHEDLTANEIQALKGLDWKQKIPKNIQKTSGTWVHIYKSQA